jgi:phage FluMu protein Com
MFFDDAASTVEVMVKFSFKVSLGSNHFEHLTEKNPKCKTFNVQIIHLEFLKLSTE